MEQKLFDAVDENQVLKVKKILHRKTKTLIDLNWKNPQSDGFTPLHNACMKGHEEIMTVLLAHPGINVNLQNDNGSTPLALSCTYGTFGAVKLLLQDSRVDINLADNYGFTPLRTASAGGRLDVVEWLLASGKESDSKREEKKVLTAATRSRTPVVPSLLKKFFRNPAVTRHDLRLKLGFPDATAAALFGLTVFLCDDYLALKPPGLDSPATRFFSVAQRLPLELQMPLCCQVYGINRLLVPNQDREVALRHLAGIFDGSLLKEPSREDESFHIVERNCEHGEIQVREYLGESDLRRELERFMVMGKTKLIDRGYQVEELPASLDLEKLKKLPLEEACVTVLNFSKKYFNESSWGIGAIHCDCWMT